MKTLFFLIFSFFVLIKNNCNFAKNFTKEELLHNEEKRNYFYDLISFYEGKFHQHGIGVNLKSGITYGKKIILKYNNNVDGHKLNHITGRPLENGLHYW
jgi:hypothetical protein